MPPGRPANHAKSWTPRPVVADDEVVQRRLGGLHLKMTWWTEESRTGGSKSLSAKYIADTVGGLHREGDWNDDRRTRGCVAGL